MAKEHRLNSICRFVLVVCLVSSRAARGSGDFPESEAPQEKLNEPEQAENGTAVDGRAEDIDTKAAGGREAKQFWPMLPSPIFLAQHPALMPMPFPGTQMAKRIIPVQELLSRAVNASSGKESDPAPVFLRTTEQLLPEGRNAAGEAERSGTDIFVGRPRVRSIMTQEEEVELVPPVQSGQPLQDGQPVAAESRISIDDLDLVESSPIGDISPRSSHYYSDDNLDEALPNLGSIRKFNKNLKPTDCCLFIFLDGSAHYFDDFLRKLTGHYRLMYGTVNNHPHYVSRNCKNPDEYNGSCTYIWYSGYGWVVGVGKYIGQTKGVIYTRQEDTCPTGLSSWRYLNEDIEWKDNGNILVECST